MPSDRDFPDRFHLLAEMLCSTFVLMTGALAPDPRAALFPRPPSATPHDMLDHVPGGARVTVAGLVLVRQRPGTAKGVIFITLEDETGVSNIVVWRNLYEKYRRAVIAGRLLRVTGKLERESGVCHIIAEHIEDMSPMLDQLLNIGATPQDATP